MAEGQGIIGHQTNVQIPQSQVNEQSLIEEKHMAKFSQTSEFKKLKEFIEARVEYYKIALPGGVDPNDPNLAGRDLSTEWKVANAVIRELEGIIRAYEDAARVVKEDAKRKNE